MKKIHKPARKKPAPSQTDSKIDFSDIPATTARDWKDAHRGMFYRPVKQQITLRLDADIVAWFKSHPAQGRGYQTSINRALREYVATHAE